MSALGRTVDFLLDHLLPRAQQERLGAHILNHARAEWNGDPDANGEYALLDRCAALARHQGGSVIFDVGANVGEWTLRAARASGAGVEIHAFEPARETFAVLSARLAADDGARLRAHRMALGSTAGLAHLRVVGRGSGLNSLHATESPFMPDGNVPETEPVELTTGDIFCAQHGIPAVEFLKIDTEGHERAVLDGFSGLLTRQGIRVIQFEYGFTWLASRTYLADEHRRLTGLGYRLAKLRPEGPEPVPVWQARHETFGCGNYVAYLPALAAEIERPW